MPVSSELMARRERLIHLLSPHTVPGLIVAFSGGVDSACLLWAAREAAKKSAGRVLAITAVSASVPDLDLRDASEFAEKLGVEHRILRSRETENQEYLKNDSNRCFHCKTELFRIAREEADAEGIQHIAYGYTISDRGDVRPGHRAARMAGVLAPLEEAELTKEDIRAILREEGFSLSEKPAAPCLSSRIQTGLPVTIKRLEDVQQVETFLRDHGVQIVRARIHDEKTIRIETEDASAAKVIELRHDLERLSRSLGYRWITLDLGGYRTGGST